MFFSKAAILVLSAAGLVWAQAPIEHNDSVLTVGGNAEIKVVPDLAVVSMGVVTRNVSLERAHADNESSVQRVLAAAAKAGVARGDVQSDYLEINPRYQYGDNRDPTKVEYCDVVRGMSITVRDLRHFDNLVVALVAAGSNQVFGVQFGTSHLREHRDKARALAIQAGIEKAQAMAMAAGLRVDKPHTIYGDVYNYWQGYGSYGRRFGFGLGQQQMGMYQNVVQAAPASGSGEMGSSGFEPGRISVTASVSMTFKLLR